MVVGGAAYAWGVWEGGGKVRLMVIIYRSTESLSEYLFFDGYLLRYTICGLSGGISHAKKLIAKQVRPMRDMKSQSAMSPPPLALTSI